MDNTQIQKPISMLIRESKEKIISAINETCLHPTILEMIIREIYLEVRDNANYTYEKECQEYFAQNNKSEDSEVF